MTTGAGTVTRVDVWFDFLCPWCLLGKRRFEAALARSGRRDAVAVHWRSFELMPDLPKEPGPTIPERMRRDLGVTAAEAARGIERLSAMAAETGLAYRLDIARPVNSFDAHRLMHAGQAGGAGDAVREQLGRAYTEHGAILSDHAVLARLGRRAGLPDALVREVLAGSAYAEDVRADERAAARLGVTGVPTFVFDESQTVSGAQPVEVFVSLLTGSAR
ncbi:DsbA family oxidoreductase [Allonocardiopsis opalescens]|uniref:Putative DsbA family dithiol-disulfide isomerase n=1 Tax=Allonocardiopsis opalescens TaxID=1144618 RepID=A0A2T0Q5H5_9ACTN|nr:DsbA family oxidoreductase [Allonocardiopsis opalescens]PRX99032.1 putative DsbA family dithiol-disulfide isomerase [Allonocardiopsis opalescens]